MLERGMLMNGEVWPSWKAVEALCVDTAVSPKEVKSCFDAVDKAIARWPRFARKAGVSAAMTEEIKKRHERIRDAVV